MQAIDQAVVGVRLVTGDCVGKIYPLELIDTPPVSATAEEIFPLPPVEREVEGKSIQQLTFEWIVWANHPKVKPRLCAQLRLSANTALSIAVALVLMPEPLSMPPRIAAAAGIVIASSTVTDWCVR